MPYIAIDLKSFYASVECVERGLDPLRTNLVVADKSRTEKTICLAVSPSLKEYGISGRARLFEVVSRVKEVNAERLAKLGGAAFSGESSDAGELSQNPRLRLSYIVAPPRMAHYLEYSAKIYDIYLRYIAPEDIHVYSVDEVFIDAAPYLGMYKMTAHELAMAMIKDVLRETGITATAGIGTNLYLCKIAMDIVAKHAKPDADGVRIAELDEMSYRQKLWTHRPLTDFWRVGRGYARKLEGYGLYTMGDIARCSLGEAKDFYNENLLYRMFGINAELLIDHAWGWEPVAIADIKAYAPETKSISSGQVLKTPYKADKARLIVHEMADLLALRLLDKGFATDQIVLTIGYDVENLKDKNISKKYGGDVKSDRYGRLVPKHAHGTERIENPTNSARLITDAALALYDRIINPELLVRRVTIVAGRLMPESEAKEYAAPRQLSLFDADEKASEEAFPGLDAAENKEARLSRERRAQEAMLIVKHRYGKNAMLKGMNFEEGATTIERNAQIGGHRAE